MAQLPAAEFLNKRQAKGEISAPQSQSNLWFVKPGMIDKLGPVIGRGALWMNENVATETAITGGLVHARGANQRTLAFAAIAAGGADLGCYELHADLTLKPAAEAALHRFVKTRTKIPVGVISGDEASVVFVDDDGKRWRLPKGDAALDKRGPLGDHRAAREVATERDLFHAHGTFYELPANNAGGFAKLRPVATHNLRVHDFCSYRGLFIMTGISNKSAPGNPHLIRSADGKAALWAGAIDDVWAMGKPSGEGGPWRGTAVKAGQPSDPYLATGYDQKSLELSHNGANSVTFRLEADFTGDGSWRAVRRFEVASGATVRHDFPASFGAYWFRLVAESDAIATAHFIYR